MEAINRGVAYYIKIYAMLLGIESKRGIYMSERLALDKNYLLELIARINTRDKQFTISTETTSYKALREAENLTDSTLFPILQEIIEGHEGKKKEKREIRDAAYFIFGRLMQKSFNQDACIFFLKRLEVETDKHVLCSMLERVKDWWKLSEITLPADLDILPILGLARSDVHQVRYSAIVALGACPRKKSRDVLAYYLTQEDEKKYKYEIYYANIAMQGIGEPEDIPLLERFVKSRKPDIKMTAQYAIQFIRERNGL